MPDPNDLLDEINRNTRQTLKYSRRRFLGTWLAVALMSILIALALWLSVTTAHRQNQTAHLTASSAKQKATTAQESSDQIVLYLQGKQGLPGVPGANGKDGNAGNNPDRGAVRPAARPQRATFRRHRRGRAPSRSVRFRRASGTPRARHRNGLGPAGPSGAAGEAGSAGEKGATGEAGHLKGEKGDEGRHRPARSRGPISARPVGPPGPQGPSGLTKVQTITATQTAMNDAPQGTSQ